jgi:hypothetical protein
MLRVTWLKAICEAGPAPNDLHGPAAAAEVLKQIISVFDVGPLTHGADCEVHCFVCMPELRERLVPRGVPSLPRGTANRNLEPSHGTHTLSPSRPVAKHDGHSAQSIIPIAL